MRIFQPDNFSESEIRYEEIDAPVFFEAVLGEYFNDYKIIKVFRLVRQEINSENFRVIVSNNGAEHSYLLRRNKILKGRDIVDFYLRWLGDLKATGVKVSTVLKTKTGELSVQNDGDAYSLFDFISATYFAPDERAMVDLAKNIAIMHLAFNSLAHGYLAKIREVSAKNSAYFNKIKEYSNDDFDKISAIISNKKQTNEADELVLENVDNIKAIVDEVVANEEYIKLFPPQIIHSDLHPHNVMMNFGEVLAIIDFDGMRVSEQDRDVAFAIYRFGRQFYVKNPLLPKEYAVVIRDNFINSYCEKKALSKNEIELMPILLKDDFLRKILFVLNEIYLNYNLAWEKDLYKFIIAFDEINYFWPK